MTARPLVQVDPDVGIPDLVRRLTDDSKRLVGDEVQLAKMEMSASVSDGARGAGWAAVAFGTGIISAVAFTVCVAALVGRLANHHYWLGALVAALVNGAFGGWLVTRGLAALSRPSYTLAETRREVAETARWAATRRTR
ncbi:MAG: hypothetical protein NVS1B4_02950 [Gemmatimonadaceae bacterium]